MQLGCRRSEQEENAQFSTWIEKKSGKMRGGKNERHIQSRVESVCVLCAIVFPDCRSFRPSDRISVLPPPLGSVPFLFIFVFVGWISILLIRGARPFHQPKKEEKVEDQEGTNYLGNVKEIWYKEEEDTTSSLTFTCVTLRRKYQLS